MNSDNVKILIDMIDYMDTKDRLRLAVKMTESSYCSIEYDRTKMFKHFDKLLKEIDGDYKNFSVIGTEYKVIVFAMAKIIEMTTEEQNQVALYLFNSIKNKIA